MTLPVHQIAIRDEIDSYCSFCLKTYCLNDQRVQRCRLWKRDDQWKVDIVVPSTHLQCQQFSLNTRRPSIIRTHIQRRQSVYNICKEQLFDLICCSRVFIIVIKSAQSTGFVIISE
jgi:hypothetical protein